MKYAKFDDNHYALKFEPGDDIHRTVQTFCADQAIKNAAVSAIGSVDSPTLAHYRMDTKKFTERKLEGIFEIVALTGNVAIVDDKPLAHIHVALSDPEMRAIGGHLKQGTCSAIIEMIVTVFPTEHTKSMNDHIGLLAWDF